MLPKCLQHPWGESRGRKAGRESPGGTTGTAPGKASSGDRFQPGKHPVFHGRRAGTYSAATWRRRGRRPNGTPEPFRVARHREGGRSGRRSAAPWEPLTPGAAWPAVPRASDRWASSAKNEWPASSAEVFRIVPASPGRRTPGGRPSPLVGTGAVRPTDPAAGARASHWRRRGRRTARSPRPRPPGSARGRGTGG